MIQSPPFIYGFHQSINFIFSDLALQKEKEELHKRILDLQRKLDGKQELELNIQQMRGALDVLQQMNHMGEDEDIKVKRDMEKIKEELKDKEEELESVEEFQQALIVKERKTNDELQDARKELINVCIINLCAICGQFQNNTLLNLQLASCYIEIISSVMKKDI